MDTNSLVYLIIGIFVLLYIVDKKDIVKPSVDQVNILANTGEVKKVLSTQEKKIEDKNKLYKTILKNIQEINPLKTYNVWTYVEIPNDSRNIQLSYTKYNIPIYFKKCIQKMKENVPNLIVLTPLNIKEYLPEFDIEMHKDSIIPIKLRIDILFASILKMYGGICVSPGTIVYDLSESLRFLHKYEVVTFGGNQDILQSQNHIYLPNSYVIGSQKGSKTITEYLRLLQMLKKNKYHHNITTSSSADILSSVLSSLKPTQFHYGTEYDGSHNSHLQLLRINDYLGTSDIDFLNKDKLMIVSFPYDILLKRTEYLWFLHLSEVQFLESRIILKRLLIKDI